MNLGKRDIMNRVRKVSSQQATNDYSQYDIAH